LDKAIVTTLMLIGSVVAAVFVFNAIYPAVMRSSDAMVAMKSRIDVRMKSQIEILHAAGELDQNGVWQDTNSDGDFDVFVWAKNVGSVRIAAVERVDVFFGPEGNFTRIPHQTNAGGTYPYWEYQVENDTEWNPTATLRITLHFSSTLSSGQYYIKVTTPSGLTDDYFFSM